MGEGREPGTLAEQGKEMAHNMAEVFDISGQIWKKFLEGQLQEGAPKHPDPLNTWPALAELYRTMWDNPKQVADATIEFWAAQQQLWQNSMLRWLGAKDAVGGPAAAAHAEGRQALQPQGLVGERGLRLPEAVVPADQRLDPGHGELGRRDGPQGAAQGGVLHPLLRRGA